MQGPALHELLNVPRADVTQTGLQAALLCPLMLQPASQGIYQDELQNETVLKTEDECRQKSYSSSKTSTAEVVQCSWKRGKSQHDQCAAYTWEQPTAQTSKIFRVSVGQQSSESFLPIVQLAALHYVSPVLGHHWWYKLQLGNNEMKLKHFPPATVTTEPRWIKHTLTIEMLFFCLLRYFCWVFLSSSSPPLIDNRMASA